MNSTSSTLQSAAWAVARDIRAPHHFPSGRPDGVAADTFVDCLRIIDHIDHRIPVTDPASVLALADIELVGKYPIQLVDWLAADWRRAFAVDAILRRDGLPLLDALRAARSAERAVAIVRVAAWLLDNAVEATDQAGRAAL